MKTNDEIALLAASEVMCVFSDNDPRDSFGMKRKVLIQLIITKAIEAATVQGEPLAHYKPSSGSVLFGGKQPDGFESGWVPLYTSPPKAEYGDPVAIFDVAINDTVASVIYEQRCGLKSGTKLYAKP